MVITAIGIKILIKCLNFILNGIKVRNIQHRNKVKVTFILMKTQG